MEGVCEMVILAEDSGQLIELGDNPRAGGYILDKGTKSIKHADASSRVSPLVPHLADSGKIFTPLPVILDSR